MLVLMDGYASDSKLMEERLSCVSWNDVLCPICLDVPHNCVLLRCSSYGRGCRPFICGTDHLHSNCLERLKEANGKSSGSQSPGFAESMEFIDPEIDELFPCPLCRGEVTGWLAIDKARLHLDIKNRTCEEEKCQFSGNYFELQKHAQVQHPHACPAKIDPVRKLYWDNFQQSSEIIDVLGTIHTEVPNGVVLGDYVIDHGGDNSGDHFDSFRDRVGKWWTSCIFCKALGNFRKARNRRRRSRVSNSARRVYRFKIVISLTLVTHRVSLRFFVKTSY